MMCELGTTLFREQVHCFLSVLTGYLLRTSRWTEYTLMSQRRQWSHWSRLASHRRANVGVTSKLPMQTWSANRHRPNVVKVWAWSWDVSFISVELLLINHFIILLRCSMQVFLINEHNSFN